MYKGKCAECGAVWNSKAFKSRPAGYDLPVVNERHLSFACESATNNKICGGCHLKNYKALKHSRDEQNVEQASNAKKVKGNDNDMGDDVSSKVGDIEVQEMVDMTEKEGTAISVLFDLSLL